MTAQKAKRIVGDEVDIFWENEEWVCEVNLTDCPLNLATVSVKNKDRAKAIQALVAECYKVRSGVVARKAGYKCEICGGTQGLQIHHKVLRSHGRSDRIENLQLLDITCHDLVHTKWLRKKT